MTGRSFHTTGRDAFSRNKEESVPGQLILLGFYFPFSEIFIISGSEKYVILTPESGFIFFESGAVSVCDWHGRFLERFVEKIQNESFKMNRS